MSGANATCAHTSLGAFCPAWAGQNRARPRGGSRRHSPKLAASRPVCPLCCKGFASAIAPLRRGQTVLLPPAFPLAAPCGLALCANAAPVYGQQGGGRGAFAPLFHTLSASLAGYLGRCGGRSSPPSAPRWGGTRSRIEATLKSTALLPIRQRLRFLGVSGQHSQTRCRCLP